MTGDLLAGRYVLGDVLGSGGMAEVRDGWDRRLQRPVAVKLLHPVFSGRPDLRRRFADEARAAAALSHPNIVSVHDFGEQNGTPFIVMERLSGETLGDLMTRGPMDPVRVRAALEQVLAALDTAHGAGVVHRDIKPANILVARQGLKVADFGIAKTEGSTHTMTGQIVGTLGYLSPERIQGAPASVADDLYAVGMVAYEALLGRPAYAHDNPAGVLHAITAGPLPPVAAFRGDADPVLAAVVERAVARDSGSRFASAGQMRAALHGARPVTRVFDQPPPVMMPMPDETRSRKGKFAITAAILAAFAVAAAALALGPFSSSPPVEPVGTSLAPTTTTPTTTTPTTSTSTPMSTPTATPVTPVIPPPEPPKEKKPKGEGHPGNGGPGGGAGPGPGRPG